MKRSRRVYYVNPKNYSFQVILINEINRWEVYVPSLKKNFSQLISDQLREILLTLFKIENRSTDEKFFKPVLSEFHLRSFEISGNSKIRVYGDGAVLIALLKT